METTKKIHCKNLMTRIGFTCYCGKKCKGLHGLKAHQSSCHVVDIPNIKELFEMQDEYVSEESDEERNEEEQINSVKERVLKGIKLRKNKDQWNIANDLFQSSLACKRPN